MSLVRVFVVCSPPADGSLVHDELIVAREAQEGLTPLPYNPIQLDLKLAKRTPQIP